MPVDHGKDFRNRRFSGVVAVLGLILVISTACQTTGPPPPSTSGQRLTIDIPFPLEGPGQTSLDITEQNAISQAWGDLLSGKTTEALATIARFSSPQTELLKLQIALAAAPTPDLQMGLQTLVDHHPRYAAAWATLSTTAEILGDESTALDSARRTSDLWPGGPYSGKADQLQSRWVTERINNSRDALAADRAMEALSIVEKALALDPDNQSGLMTRAEALMGLQQGPEAEAALSQLGTLPEALMLRAELAADQNRWQHAMDLLNALPQGYPDKDRLLRRAQLMWRMSILPPYVHDAVDSKSITREQLAVILVAMVPSLEVQAGGTTPLMTDVIDLPSQRAILTTARLEIMAVDRVAMLFHPQRPVTLAETQSAIQAVCHLAGFSPPLWCQPEMDSPDEECINLEEPIQGMNLVDILLSVEARTNT